MDSRLLSGTVDMLILDVVSRGKTYGYDITQQVLDRSRGYFQLTEGSLYPALHRLERRKLLASTWAEVDGRRRKYYRITSAGNKALAVKRDEWSDFSRGINGVLGVTYGMA